MKLDIIRRLGLCQWCKNLINFSNVTFFHIKLGLNPNSMHIPASIEANSCPDSHILPNSSCLYIWILPQQPKNFFRQILILSDSCDQDAQTTISIWDLLIFITSGIFRWAIGPWPPFGKNFFFTIGKKLENMVWPPFVWELVASKNSHCSSHFLP